MSQKDQSFTEKSVVDLEHRIARCELMIAAMLIANSGKVVPFDVREELEKFFASRTSNADLIEFLRGLLEPHPEYAADPFGFEIKDAVFTSINELRHETAEFKSTIEHIRQTLADYRDEATATRTFDRMLRNDFDSFQESFHDLHSFLSCQSMGIDVASAHLVRYLPVRAFLDTNDRADVNKVASALHKCLVLLDFEFVDEYPEEHGSWWKRWFAKTKDAITQEAVLKRLEMIERAVQLQGINKPQAEIDQAQADGTAKLIASLDHIPSAAIQVGSLLIVKTTDVDGQCKLIARTLTTAQMIELDHNNDLLKAPDSILTELDAVVEADARKFIHWPADRS